MTSFEFTPPDITEHHPVSRSRWRAVVLHSARLAIVVAILVLIHLQHRQLTARRASLPYVDVPVARFQQVVPSAVAWAEPRVETGERDLLSEEGSVVGTVIQTSPAGDDVVGFSGPTNSAILFDADNRIVRVMILGSEDTIEHVDAVESKPEFFRQYEGLTWEDAARLQDVDTVSGATLTSLAIVESISLRLGGGRPSLRFPDAPTCENIAVLFPECAKLVPHEGALSRWTVVDGDGKELGWILQTSPEADQIVGYQGPTNAFIGFTLTGDVVGVAIGASYDNEPYVGYVREDRYFRRLLEGKTLSELATIDPIEEQIEGVSGATMTSQAVVDGVIAAAAKAEQRRQQEELAATQPQEAAGGFFPGWGTLAVIGGALVIGLTRLRSSRWLRVVWQVVLIAYLGLINGDLLSQAMLVGWARSGVPWANAVGLVALTVAAFLVPIITKRNLYCHHVCPHGAAQHFVRGRLLKPLQLPRRWDAVLRTIPVLLLLVVVGVGMTQAPFSLVNIEPFDAYVWHIAGGATIAIAVIGLVASLFVPLAYCRYGCPTGALLEFVRRTGRSDRWSKRDTCAVLLLAVAVAAYWGRWDLRGNAAVVDKAAAVSKDETSVD